MHSMYNNDQAVAHFPAMGTDIPFRNVSGEVQTVDNYQRPAQSRDGAGPVQAPSPYLDPGTGRARS